MSGSVSSLDPSIPGRALVPPANPLAQMSSVQGFLNEQARNRLLGNENTQFQAKVASGRAYQGAIDPQTGAFDPGKYRTLLAADPAAATEAGAGVAQAQTISTDQLAQQLKKFDFINQNASSLYAKSQETGQPITQSDVYDVMRNGLGSGVLTPADVAGQLAVMPADPAGLQQWVQQHRYNAMDMQQRLTQSQGAPVTISDGKTLQGGVQNQRTGALNPGGAKVQLLPGPQYVSTGGANVPTSGGEPTGGPAIPNTTSPETRAALVESYQPDPSNPARYIRTLTPRSQLPGASGAPAGATPPAPTNGLPADAGYTGAPKPILAAPPQGVPEANEADTKLFTTDRANIPAVQLNVRNLQHAADALALISTGPSTEGAQRIASFLAANGLATPNVTANAENYDIFRKYAEKYAAQQGDASGTDIGRNMALASNAGTPISTAANQQVLKTEIGNQRLKIAQVMLNPDQQTGIGYGKHASSFATTYDPRGFAVDQYSPAELTKMKAGMSPGDLAKFNKSVGAALRLKLITPQGTPAQPAAPQPGQ